MEPMSKVTTIKGNLFDAPKGSIIIHACNTKGVWGSGIAKSFAVKYNGAYNVYRAACLSKGSALLGTCLLIPTHNHVVACLFTSKSYGHFVDKPAMILNSTETALADLIKQNVGNLPLHTCKINSGLFNVPWRDTKALLKATGQDFVVYDF
jgi:ADP-ribose 1''-phosphate phosphatase